MKDSFILSANYNQQIGWIPFYNKVQSQHGPENFSMDFPSGPDFSHQGGRGVAGIQGGGGFKAGVNNVCYRCEMTGHFARECPELERGVMVGGSGCYKCGRKGHFVRECPEGDGYGLMDREDRRGSKDGFNSFGGYGAASGSKCYKCNRFGHFARECREEEERCYKCHGIGHIARDCKQEKDTCYNCNQVGHIMKDCPNGGSKTCYKCGGVGHVVRDCPLV